MFRLGQQVVKATARLDGAFADGQGLAADLLDLILAHAVFDFGEQWLVPIDLSVGGASRHCRKSDEQCE
ncbi:hypothetical protein D3C86_2066500 [compost metagenome]